MIGSPYGAVFALEAEVIGDHGDELTVCGLSLDAGDRVTEKSLQGLDIAAVPGHSIAWRMARSTREGVVPKRRATSG